MKIFYQLRTENDNRLFVSSINKFFLIRVFVKFLQEFITNRHCFTLRFCVLPLELARKDIVCLRLSCKKLDHKKTQLVHDMVCVILNLHFIRKTSNYAQNGTKKEPIKVSWSLWTHFSDSTKVIFKVLIII